MLTLLINATIIYQYAAILFNSDDEGVFVQGYDEYTEQTKALRVSLVIMSQLLIQKSQYFLQLVDQVAPLIDIAVQIVLDITWFMFILVLYCASFSFCFYLLAQNQINFDNIDAD